MNRDSYPAQPYPAGYHPTAPAYPPAPAHRTVRRRTAYAAAAVAFVLGAVIGAASAGKNGGTGAARTPVSGNPTVSAAASDAAAAAHPVTAAPPAASPAPAAAASIGPGTYAVGTDIKPGLYKTSGPNDNGIGMCYWERSSSLSGDFASIIANGDPTGPTTVQVSASDKGFKTDGCAPWVKVG